MATYWDLEHSTVTNTDRSIAVSQDMSNLPGFDCVKPDAELLDAFDAANAAKSIDWLSPNKNSG